jgi:hypothetical protein
MDKQEFSCERCSCVIDLIECDPHRHIFKGEVASIVVCDDCHEHWLAEDILNETFCTETLEPEGMDEFKWTEETKRIANQILEECTDALPGLYTTRQVVSDNAGSYVRIRHQVLYKLVQAKYLFKDRTKDWSRPEEQRWTWRTECFISLAVDTLAKSK